MTQKQKRILIRWINAFVFAVEELANMGLSVETAFLIVWLECPITLPVFYAIHDGSITFRLLDEAG